MSRLNVAAATLSNASFVHSEFAETEFADAHLAQAAFAVDGNSPFGSFRSAARLAPPASASSNGFAWPPVTAGSSSGRGDAATAEHLAVNAACLPDVRCWLSYAEVLNSSVDIWRANMDITVLSEIPKPKAEEERPLLRARRFEGMRQGKHRSSPEIIGDLRQNCTSQLANSPGKLAAVVLPDQIINK